MCEWSVNEALERLRQENRSGIYKILIKDMNKCAGICPRLYDEIIFRETSRLIYIGQANGNGLLLNRLRQELLGVGRGTFFRSIGAILGESPRLARNQTEIKNFVFEGAAYETLMEENIPSLKSFRFWTKKQKWFSAPIPPEVNLPARKKFGFAMHFHCRLSHLRLFPQIAPHRKRLNAFSPCFVGAKIFMPNAITA